MFLPLKLLLTSQFGIRAGCRFVSSTTTKLTRFQNGGFRNRLKNEVNAKMEANQSYVQEGAELRPKSHLWRAAAFTALTGITTFSIASISEYQKTKKSFHDFVNDSLAEFKRIYFGQQELNKKRMDSVIATLIASNVAVFALWRFTQLRSFMNLFFMNGFASKLLCLPMLLSVFSHSNFLHLCANMYVLNSFADATLEFLGKEQFLAFYLTAGVFASFISLCEKSFTKTLIPSLGASGAIAALIGYVCIVASDAKISILFIPQFQFSAGNGLIGIILFEAAMLVVGMFTKFRIFDNAAHLGGLLFGVWYAQRGQHFYSQNFSPLLHNYCESSGYSNSIKKDNRNTPVIIYDGKNHVHTTLDELQNDEDDFQYNVENKRLEADRLKKLQQLNNQLQIRKQWGKYQREKEDKQRQRKEKIFEERRRMRMEEETEEDEDNNNQNNEEET